MLLVKFMQMKMSRTFLKVLNQQRTRTDNLRNNIPLVEHIKKHTLYNKLN